MRIAMKQPSFKAALPWLGCLALLATTACSQEPLPPLEHASAAAQAGIAGYVLAPGDALHIVVYNEPELTGDYLVLPEGTIQVPLLGVIGAKGLTTEQLTQAITTGLLRKGILQKPYVSVNLAQLRPVFVTGAVNKPGAYPFVPDMSVAMAVALAGGYTDRGARQRVVIQHLGAKEHQYAINPAIPIKLTPGDLVKIPERNF